MRLAVDVAKSTGSGPVSAECSWTRSRWTSVPFERPERSARLALICPGQGLLRQRPGRHLVTENVRGQLVQRGIQPSDARKAAMPSAVLADILGRSPGTAARWAALSAHDWAHYTAQRATPPDE